MGQLAQKNPGLFAQFAQKAGKLVIIRNGGDDMPKQYTVVLVHTPAGVVLINRKKVPYIGLWNGLGGKFEAGESALDCAQREVFEESGLTIRAPKVCGIVHWYVDDQLRGDLHLVKACADDLNPQAQMTREGVITAWPETWLHDPENLGLVPDLAAMLQIFKQADGQEYVSKFHGDTFLSLEPAYA
jgi:8-oxo-dGTP diphosphatase